MTEPIKQVLCIKWGTRYGPEYVNRIYSMVERNITPPFRVICLTDDIYGIRKEVLCRGLPDLGCPRPTNAPGKWPKTALWCHTLFDITGVVLFIDLDVIITGSLDPFFSYGKQEDVVLARNWVKPLERLGQTSIFRFEIGRHAYMLENFQKDPEGVASKYQFEQRYVTNCVVGGVKFWPRGWIRHFRMDCLGPWPLRYLRAPRLHKGTRVVIFPGKPDPADAIQGRWSDQVESGGRLEHIKLCFSRDFKGSSYRHIKRFFMPANWIKEHWRE
jgi:hypothetical protein